MRNTIRNQQHVMNMLVHKIDMNPLQQLQRAAVQALGCNNARFLQADEHVDTCVRLHPRPATLQQLWYEYLNGIGETRLQVLYKS